MKYFRVEEMVGMIDEPNGSICRKIVEENKALFQKVQGASYNHQAWPGGYYDHVQEVMNVAIVLYERLHSLRRLPFSLSDALLVVFLHDLEKPWKYEIGQDGRLRYKEELRSKKAQHEFKDKKLKTYGIVLTDEQKNGMKYVEGEFEDYSNTRRAMGPLAAFAHLCDITSARIWFDFPKAENDEWQGSGRFRD